MALTDIEIQTAASILRRMDDGTGFIPQLIFEAVVPQVVTAPVELGIFRGPKASREVLMVQRPLDDPHFLPGGWHMPGTVMRVSDTCIEDALQRLRAEELEHALTAPFCLGHIFMPKQLVANRPAMSLLYAAKVDEDYDGKGTFFRADAPPETTLPHHRVLLEAMLERLPDSF